MKCQGDKFALAFEVGQFRLREGCLTFRTPDGRGLPAIDQSLAIEVDKRQLGSAPGEVIDRAIGITPVYRESKPLPERPVVRLGLLTDLQAFLDEGRTPHFGSSGVQALFNKALGGKAVVVVAHRVKDIVTMHAPEAGEEIGLAVRIGVTEVNIPRNR